MVVTLISLPTITTCENKSSRLKKFSCDLEDPKRKRSFCPTRAAVPSRGEEYVGQPQQKGGVRNECLDSGIESYRLAGKIVLVKTALKHRSCPRKEQIPFEKGCVNDKVAQEKVAGVVRRYGSCSCEYRRWKSSCSK